MRPHVDIMIVEVYNSDDATRTIADLRAAAGRRGCDALFVTPNVSGGRAKGTCLRYTTRRSRISLRMMSNDDVEREFDELSLWTAAELTRVRGDLPAEDAALEKAVRRYVEVRRKIAAEEPWAYATHFFGADGIAFERKREPAFGRIEGVDVAARDRWCDFVGKLAMRLESEEIDAQRRG